MDQAASRSRIEIAPMPEEVQRGDPQRSICNIEEQALDVDRRGLQGASGGAARDIAAAQGYLDKRKAEVQNEKDAIVKRAGARAAKLEGAQLGGGSAPRARSDLAQGAPEIRDARIPDLQRRLHAAEEALNVSSRTAPS